MNKAKTITLTIDEFSRILGISDPSLRESILTAVQNAAANPQSIDLSAYTDAHPLIHSLVKKLKTRAEAARRRAEKRAGIRKATLTQQPHTPPQSGHPATMAVDMELTDFNVRCLLWIKQHGKIMIDSLMHIFKAQHPGSVGHAAIEWFNVVSADLKEYFRPMIEVASHYFKLPKYNRPHSLRIPVATAK